MLTLFRKVLRNYERLGIIYCCLGDFSDARSSFDFFFWKNNVYSGLFSDTDIVIPDMIFKILLFS